MPRMDKTGPQGTGPIGWGRGGCRQEGATPQDTRGRGWRRCFGPWRLGGMGAGRGRGRGFGGGFRGGNPLASAEDEITAIEQEIAALQKRLEALRQSQSGKE